MNVTEAFSGIPSDFKNPFKLDSVTEISITCRRGIFESTKHIIYVRGYVSFQNNNTSGSQEFEGETFTEVYQKILNFLNSLK